MSACRSERHTVSKVFGHIDRWTHGWNCRLAKTADHYPHVHENEICYFGLFCWSAENCSARLRRYDDPILKYQSLSYLRSQPRER
jgi:hypothetical protein